MQRIRQLELAKPNDFNLKQNLIFLTRSEQEILHNIHDDAIFTVVTIDSNPYVIKLHEETDTLIVSFLNQCVNFII